MFAKDTVSGANAMSPVNRQSPSLINYMNNMPAGTEQQKPFSAAPGIRRKVIVPAGKPVDILSDQRDQNPGLSSKQSTNFTHAPPLARAQNSYGFNSQNFRPFSNQGAKNNAT